MLYKAFSVHQKHQVVAKISLADAIELLKVLDSYLKRSTDEVISTFDKPCKPMGAKGTISSQTQSSVSMILKGLQDLAELLKELNTSYEVDLHTCLTVQVENLHAMGHFKDQFPTCLQYARNLANTVYENIKRVVQWAAYYFTHEKSYYPVTPQMTPLNALSKMNHLKPIRKLNSCEKELMREWAENYGKAVRQRTVRQETTMFKAGTLPLNMYATSVAQNEKVTFQTRPSDAPVDVDQNEQQEDAAEMSREGSRDTGDCEQESEYDTDSDIEDQVDNEDEMTFLRAVTTRSGRMVKVTSKFF